MTSFWSMAAAMLAAALAFLLIPLLRARRELDIDNEAAELAVYRRRLQELKQERALGTLSAQEYEAARAELEQALARDLAGLPPAPSVQKPGQARWQAVTVFIVLPLLAIGMYQWLGAQAKVSAELASASQREQREATLRGAVQRLEQKLAQNPADGRGWYLLGRSAYELKDYSKSVAALARATLLLDEDADVLLDYAQALSSNQDDRLSGAPAKLIQRALALSANNPRALWMAATSELEAENKPNAKRYFEQLASLVKSGTEAERMIKAQLDKLKDVSAVADGAPSTPALSTVPNDGAGPSNSSQAASSKASIAVKVTLDPALKPKADPSDTVFVFARAKEGPRMPLAVVRAQVKDLPLDTVLDDTKAMSSSLTLSSVPQVVVGARISRSGQPIPKSGDLEGFAANPVMTSAATPEPIAVRINRAVP
jgi:cytochrome c-type biogenesis protein CcmH